MEERESLDRDYEVFSAKRFEDIIIFRFKENLLYRATELGAKATVLNYLSRVSESDSIKVVVIMGSPQETGLREYVQFYRQVLELGFDQSAIQRTYNTIDQFILKILDLNKIVIHADSRRVISLFLNVSLACDYRIVSDSTIFQKLHLKLGLVPKGGCAFFLSKMLGSSKAAKLLLSDKDITAQEAMRLGMVDKVVPLDKVEETALKVSQYLAQKPARSLTGVKRLLNYPMDDLMNYLEFENEELFKIVASADFKKTLAEYTEGRL
jgi:enoyl-CoA hydratase/carnithine racemase